MTVSRPDPRDTYSGPGSTASGHPHVVATRRQAADLAAWLLSPNRTVPAVVVSSRIGHPDLDAVAGEHAGVIECYLLEDTRIAGELSDHMPAGTAVYGEAVRYYPAGPDAFTAKRGAPLVTYRGLPEAAQIAARLVGEATRPAAPAPESGLRLEPDGVVHEIRNDRDAARLARHLLDSGRTWPVVVVSIAPEAAGPYLDATGLADQLKDAAAVVLITADATYGLTDSLGDKTLSVFYGAGRVYPPGRAWTSDMYRAPLHLCLHPSRGARVAEAVAADALAAALSAGLLTREAQRPEDESVAVEVRSTMGPSHTLVRTEDGRDAVMITARLGSELPGSRLVRRGQRLTGRLRHREGPWPAFLPDPLADEPAVRAREQFPDGTRTLARTERVAGHEATVLLHPEVRAAVDTGDEEADVLLSPGDVVAVEVVWVGDSPYAALLGDPADMALAPAIGVLPGGPPWLTEQDAVVAAETPEPAPPAGLGVVAGAGPAGARVADLEPDDARRQLRTARDAGEMLALELAEVQAQRDRLQAEVKRLQDRLRKAKSKQNRATTPIVWRDPVRQLRHEIEQAYLQRIEEDDRPARPLPEHYRIGPRFVRSLDDLQGIARDKVLDVMVECLVGLDKELASRQRHPWLVARAGRQEVRDSDGAEAWRVSLQANAPGARRLKYWVLRDQTVEFDSVGHHDDGLH